MVDLKPIEKWVEGKSHLKNCQDGKDMKKKLVWPYYTKPIFSWFWLPTTCSNTNASIQHLFYKLLQDYLIIKNHLEKEYDIFYKSQASTSKYNKIISWILPNMGRPNHLALHNARPKPVVWSDTFFYINASLQRCDV